MIRAGVSQDLFKMGLARIACADDKVLIAKGNIDGQNYSSVLYRGPVAERKKGAIRRHDSLACELPRS